MWLPRQLRTGESNDALQTRKVVIPVLVIDAHAHICSEDGVRYPTIDSPLRPPGSSGSLSVFEAIAGKNQIAGACIVQTLSFYGWDNHLLRDLSRAFPKQIAGVCS